jgi:DNA-directed RNA polymerase subunit RPC12/RpoP
VADYDRLAVTLQYSINHGRNCRLKTVTIFISTLSECLAALKELEEMKKGQEEVEPEKIPGTKVVRCGNCMKLFGDDANFCPYCGRKVK